MPLSKSTLQGHCPVANFRICFKFKITNFKYCIFANFIVWEYGQVKLEWYQPWIGKQKFSGQSSLSFLFFLNNIIEYFLHFFYCLFRASLAIKILYFAKHFIWSKSYSKYQLDSCNLLFLSKNQNDPCNSLVWNQGCI